MKMLFTFCSGLNHAVTTIRCFENKYTACNVIKHKYNNP